jgi:hypothetical protein
MKGTYFLLWSTDRQTASKMLGYLSNEEDGGCLIAGLKNSDFQKMYDQDQSSRMVMIPFNKSFF